MNDQHDNEQTDKEMLAKYEQVRDQFDEWRDVRPDHEEGQAPLAHWRVLKGHASFDPYPYQDDFPAGRFLRQLSQDGGKTWTTVCEYRSIG
jgi:hypothetical protein